MFKLKPELFLLRVLPRSIGKFSFTAADLNLEERVHSRLNMKNSPSCEASSAVIHRPSHHQLKMQSIVRVTRSKQTKTRTKCVFAWDNVGHATNAERWYKKTHTLTCPHFAPTSPSREQFPSLCCSYISFPLGYFASYSP